MSNNRKRNQMNATPITQRQYLIEKGFKVGQRGRFTKEQVQVLKDSGLEFTKPITDGQGRGKVSSVPLV
jgi:hypothetical protein